MPAAVRRLRVMFPARFCNGREAMSWDELAVGELGAVAQPLAHASLELSDLAATMPDSPNAGPSTANVGDALVRICGALETVCLGSARLAEIVIASGIDYAETDRSTSHALDSLGDALAVSTESGR